jgi:hypothetical protein
MFNIQRLEFNSFKALLVREKMRGFLYTYADLKMKRRFMQHI